MKKADYILIICFVLISLGIMGLRALAMKTNLSNKQVVVTIDGKEYCRLDLNENITKSIPTADGNSKLMVSNGQCYMEYANCPDQICVKHKPIQMSGECIICLPYKIIVAIEGNGEAEYDN